MFISCECCLISLLSTFLSSTIIVKIILKCSYISLRSAIGKVELENLPLKKDALRHLGLPVEVKAGFIGKVQLQVPVRQIRSAPWLIAIEKLYLVATPVNLDEVNKNNNLTEPQQIPGLEFPLL